MQIISLYEVTSTNDVAKELAKSGALDCLACVLAEVQTAGRGRLGKVWTTIPNHSLALSVIIPEKFVMGKSPDGGEISHGELLPLVSSIAVHQALFKHARCSIKWPNDILIGGANSPNSNNSSGKKVSGILVERVGGDNEEVFYIVGIGANLTLPEEGFPEGFIGTSLQSSYNSEDINKDMVLQNILENIKNCLDILSSEGWVGSLSNYYDEHCKAFDNQVTWQDPKTKKDIIGIARGVNQRGALVLQLEDGSLKEISSGEIIVG